MDYRPRHVFIHRCANLFVWYTYVYMCKHPEYGYSTRMVMLYIWMCGYAHVCIKTEIYIWIVGMCKQVDVGLYMQAYSQVCIYVHTQMSLYRCGKASAAVNLFGRYARDLCSTLPTFLFA